MVYRRCGRPGGACFSRETEPAKISGGASGGRAVRGEQAAPAEIITPMTVEERVRILALHPTFAHFDGAALRAVAARCRSATFPAGATIMRQGDPGNFAYLILDGEADVFVEIPVGRITMATLGRHHTIGELGAFTDMPRTATVVARTDLATLRIDHDALMSLAADFPAIPLGVIRELGRRLHSMNKPLAYLTYAAGALARDEYDPAFLTELTDQQGELAAFARVFANMAAEIRDKQQRRREMGAAADLQKSILPGPLAQNGAARAVDLHAEMHPARDIGGDFYDYLLVDDKRLVVTLADVSGKGIPAALFMAVSRTVMRSIAGQDDMAAAMRDANRLLSSENEALMFVTVFYGVLDLANGVLRWCNAGHNPPYLLRAQGGREMLRATGVPFGVDPAAFHRVAESVLAPGDGLFLYSDGITEAFNSAGELYGSTRLEHVLGGSQRRSAAEIVGDVLADTARFAAGAEQSDDIACLALRYRP
jgi:serine phosphatase RsbU (regulator of sigma subunit)